MKGKRRCWGIRSGNHLAVPLRAYHASAFENLFADLPEAPKQKDAREDPLPMSGASKVPGRESRGYDSCHTLSLANRAGTYLSELCRNMLRGSGNNF